MSSATNTANARRNVIAFTLAAAAALASLAVWAYPMPGPTQETYVVYYADATRTAEVGYKAIAQGAQCGIHHVDWGRTTAYSQVVVSECPGAEPPPIEY